MEFRCATALLMNAGMSEVLCEVTNFQAAGDNLTASALCRFEVPFSFAIGGHVAPYVILADSRPFHIRITRCSFEGSHGFAEGVIEG